MMKKTNSNTDLSFGFCFAWVVNSTEKAKNICSFKAAAHHHAAE